MNKPKTILGPDLGTTIHSDQILIENFIEIKSPTEARLRKSSAYSLIVICLSRSNNTIFQLNLL